MIKARFDAEGIEIPFPHQTLYWGEDKVGNAPPLRMLTQQIPEQHLAAPEQQTDR